MRKQSKYLVAGVVFFAAMIFIGVIALWFGKPVTIPRVVTSTEVEQWKTYTHPTYGFEVKYPPNWFIIDNPNTNSITLSNVQHLSQPGSFLPLIFQGDPFKNEAVFLIEISKGAGTLKSAVQRYVEYLKNDSLSHQYSVGTIDGREAVKETATSKDAYQFYYVNNGNYAFRIGYRTHQLKFENYYIAMLESFRFPATPTSNK